MNPTPHGWRILTREKMGDFNPRNDNSGYNISTTLTKPTVHSYQYGVPLPADEVFMAY
jgi:hypothetical protein